MNQPQPSVSKDSGESRRFKQHSKSKNGVAADFKQYFEPNVTQFKSQKAAVYSTTNSCNKLKLSTMRMQKIPEGANQSAAVVPAAATKGNSHKKNTRFASTLSPTNQNFNAAAVNMATSGPLGFSDKSSTMKMPDFEKKILTLYHTSFGTELNLNNSSNFNTQRDSCRKKDKKRKKMALTPINRDLLSLKNNTSTSNRKN